MKRFIFICCSLMLLASSNTLYAAGAVKLVDYMISSSGLTEILAKNGIQGVDAKQIQSYVTTSISSFGAGKTLTQKEFAEVLSKIPTTGEDATIRKNLQVLLDKSDTDIKKEDVVNAINNIIYLANRYGKSVVITCAECVSESLTRNGFKFTVENIKNAGSVKLLADIIPSNPKDLKIFITSKAKRLGFGNYSLVSPSVILPEEEKSLALFLALAESGSKVHKEFADTIKKLSTNSKGTNLFNSNDTNKLWKIVTTDVSDEQLVRMTELLKEVQSVLNKERKLNSGVNQNVKIEDAFNQVLKKRAEGSDDLFQKFKNIKAKRCFFR
jgi:hypothetical protein